MNTTADSLLEGARANDADSWSRIVHLYMPLVLWWCRQRGLNGRREEAAQDVIQNVFKEVARKIKTFRKDGQAGAFRRWLYQITDYKVREYWRQELREPAAPGGSCAQELLDEVPAEGPSDSSVVSPRIILLRQAMRMIRDKVKPRTWEAVWQVVVEGRYAQDVATEFGMTVGALFTAKSRALSALRSAYTGLLDDQEDE